MELNSELRSKIKAIDFLILDVDGVLTDGKIIIDDHGNETKQFHVRDGHGIKLLQRAGVEVMLLTGRISGVVTHRARELGIEEVYQGAKNKVEVLETILQKRAISGNTIAYVGDDVVDIPVFNRVGFAAAVADAAELAKEAADYLTEHRGGDGAVREVCELIIAVKGKWDDVMARYEVI